MPACLLEPIPSQSMYQSLMKALESYANGLSITEPVPIMGAEEMRLCLIAAKEGWPK
jgi:hypothetical protein